MVSLPQTLVSTKGDRFHEHIFDVLVFCSMLAKAADSTSHSVVPPGSLAKVECEHLPYEILFDAHAPADAAMVNQTPTHLSLPVRLKMKEHHPFRTEGTASITVRIFAAIFALACEGPLGWQKGISTDLSKWPPVLAFCRVVRNAIAHNGRVRIDNAKAPPVTWRGLTYSYSDNGLAILGPGVGTGDLLILLFDLDEELNAIGAPTTWP
jgi:hypothetical protein